MPVEKTAYKHFLDDISRARALLDLSSNLPRNNPADNLIHDDVLRSAWMFTVGSFDAYFCDKYGDFIAATLIAKNREKSVPLPDAVKKLRVPVSAFLSPRQERENWRWRMAARGIIEKDNVLSLKKVSQVLNPYLLDGQKLFGDVLDTWMKDPKATKACFGVRSREYAIASPQQKSAHRKAAKKKLENRFKSIFQRRHDCIHNCDRPKISVQGISPGMVKTAIRDIQFLVDRCDVHLNASFRAFLIHHGFSGATATYVGY